MPHGIRPTQDVTREALFDILGQDMEGIVLLDLFAGSGAVGLEALSRGAEEVVFVEKNPKCAEVIQENLTLLGIGGAGGSQKCEIAQTDAYAAVKLFDRRKLKFDVVFVDPPYSRGLAKKALKTLGAYDILQPNCVMVIQHAKREILPERQGRILLFRQKKYGNTFLSIYKEKS